MELFSDDAIQALLIQHQIADLSQLEALQAAQAQELKQRQRQISGRAYLIDPVAGELLVQEHPEGEDIQRFALHKKRVPAFNLADYSPWGQHVLLAERNDGSRRAQRMAALDQPYGLVTPQDFTYLYPQGHNEAAYLGLSHQALFAGMASKSLFSGPFDLFMSENQRWLCVGNRGAGTVTAFCTDPLEELGTVQIRPPGSSKCLNIAINESKELAYITDNQTSALFVLSFARRENAWPPLKLEQNWVGLGNLGNLVIAPDHEHIYLLSLQPQMGLHYLSMGQLGPQIELQGLLRQDLGLSPCDLLSISPEGEHLLVMTADPETQQPMMNVIDARQKKVSQHYLLKEDLLPAQLTHAFANPLDFPRRSLEELVLDAGLISEAELNDLKASQLPPTPAPAEDKALNLSTVIQNNPEADTLNLTPKKSSRIELPAEVTTEIVALLLKTFQQQTQLDPGADTLAQERLREAAEAAREQLEIFDSTIVQIEEVFQKQGLKTVLVREAVLRALEARQEISADQPPPARCPNCNHSLDSWDCNSCGFELESPDRLRKRRVASAEATANLPPGHLVIPDPQGMRLLQLNPYKYISWHLSPDKLPCESPYDTLWLPSNNILVADKDGHAVMEVGLQGTVYWRFDTEASAAHRLREPVKATYYLPEDTGERHYLIVDQGQHRVIETNSSGELLKVFGVQGQPGSDDDHLNGPSDVQYTHQQTYLIADTGNHRVLEFAREGHLLQSWGPEELGLKSPACAQRLLNDHTLILDAGNYRLLELNSLGEVINECAYFSASVDPAFQIVFPTKMIRLLNQDLLILDEDKLVQLNPKTRQLVWFSKIEDLAFQPRVDAPQLVVDENGVEQLVYKVLDHGELRPARLAQKVNFKRMQKMIAARIQQEASAQPEAEDKTAKKLQALIEDKMAEQKRKLRTQMTTSSVQPSQVFEKPDAGLKKLETYIVDKHHNAVLRINRKGEVRWHYGFEMGQTLSRPFHVTETHLSVLIADNSNNRVLEVSKSDREVLREVKGPPRSPLGGPRAASALEDQHLVVADQRNKRLVELNAAQEIVWSYQEAGKISSPQSVEALGNGNLLFADAMLNTVREINRAGESVWYYGSRLKGKGPGQLFGPEFATRLANGHTLIADTRNNRILEVSPEGREVWFYEGDPVTRRPIINPTRAERLENGNTLITFNNQREMIEVDPAGQLLWSFKMGNDVFLEPISGHAAQLKIEVEVLESYYNPIEKRLFQSAAQRNTQPLEAHITLMDNVQMKSVRASLLMMQLEQCGTVVKTFPSPEEILADKVAQQLILAFTLDAGSSPETARELLSNVAEVAEVVLKPITVEA